LPAKSRETTGTRKSKGLLVSDPKLIVDGSDLQFRRLIHNFLLFGSRLQKLNTKVAGLMGLTETDFTIVMSIRHLEKDGRPNISQLADYLNLSSPLITNRVTGLIKRSLLAKQAASSDRRVMLLSLTPAARALIEERSAQIAQLNDLAMAAVSRDMMNKLIPLLAKLAEDVETASGFAEFLIRTAGRAPGPRRASDAKLRASVG
jgi:DNA-binding MarR family transcriptional regulator